MPRARPLLQCSIGDLEAKSVDGSPGVIDELLHELSCRRSRGAKALLKRLNGNSTNLNSPATATDDGGRQKHPSHSAPRIQEHSTGRGLDIPLPEYPPTPEQHRAIEAFANGGSLKISAFAGAGKTSTLQFMAAARQDRGLYLAFNRSIANEARSKFPTYVDSRTTHSLAARYVRSAYGMSKSKMFDPLSANQLAAILELKRVSIDGQIALTPQQLAYLFFGTVRGFCRSADPAIVPEHIPVTGRLRGLDEQTRDEFRQWIVEQAAALWSRMIDRQDDIPLGHDGYLKLWSMDSPHLDYKFILLDEAQDTNPVVLHVLRQQAHAQMIYVGDQHQQIYEWRGAVDAMTEMTTDSEAKLTQSFRFGQVIADAANLVLRTLGETEALRGFDKINSAVNEDVDTRAILARTNSTVISETLGALDRGRTPCIVGGTQELEALVKDVYSLMDGQPGAHPEFFGFTHWDEVIAFSDTDEGENIRPFVSLVQQNGAGGLWAAIKRSVDDEDKADVVISTAHKGKGREWTSVRIADDFSSSKTDDGRIPSAEARLMYVAMTRAKEILSIKSELLNAFTTGTAVGS